MANSVSVSNRYVQMRIHGKQGDFLTLHDWPLGPGIQAKGLVVVVHGLGEHGGRYHHVAKFFNELGYVVRSYDHAGHGASSGARGCLSHDLQLVDDLTKIIDKSREDFGSNLPLLILGHSMGGVVAASFVARKIRSVDGLILSSPALLVKLNLLQKTLLGVLPKVAPNFCIANGVSTQYLSHDPGLEVAYRKDGLVHDRISGRLAFFIVEESKKVQMQASQWQVPTLLIFAGDDRQVASDGSRIFVKNAPPEVVKCKEFPHLYHEIFNEKEADPVFSEVKLWILDRERSARDCALL